jgi:hypothetical protein
LGGAIEDKESTLRRKLLEKKASMTEAALRERLLKKMGKTENPQQSSDSDHDKKELEEPSSASDSPSPKRHGRKKSNVSFLFNINLTISTLLLGSVC